MKAANAMSHNLKCFVQTCQGFGTGRFGSVGLTGHRSPLQAQSTEALLNCGSFQDPLCLIAHICGASAFKAVSQHWGALWHASEDLRDDRDVVMKAATPRDWQHHRMNTKVSHMRSSALLCRHKAVQRCELAQVAMKCH